jgi:predicted GH43/DUF377 family glycosyl hydrolase
MGIRLRRRATSWAWAILLAAAGLAGATTNEWVKYDNTKPNETNTVTTNGRIADGLAGSGDSLSAHTMRVIKDGGIYRMWYAGSDTANWRIYYATSPDGLTWTKYDNAVPSDSDGVCTNGKIAKGSAARADGTHVHSGCVIKDGDTYKMWYTGASGAFYRIYYATSLDGLTWTKYDNTLPATNNGTSSGGRIPQGSSERGDCSNAVAPCVIKDGATYKMWYSGTDGTNYRTYYATSYDGLAWTKYDNTKPASNDVTGTNGRIPTGFADKGDMRHAYTPCVIKDDATYRMWYTGSEGPTAANSSRVYYATSPDGLTWTKYTNTIPATNNGTSTAGRVPLGSSERGDWRNASYAWVIRDGGQFKMWYGGSDNTNTRVFHATQNIPWPTVANGSALNVTDTSADFVGQLVATGDAPAEVYVFWGTNDAGFVRGNWQATNYLGTNATGWFTNTVSLPDPAARYYYRYYATNSAGEDWADTAASTLPDSTTNVWVKYDNTIPATSDTVSVNGRVTRGSSTRGDSKYLYGPSVLKEGNTYRMWYNANDNANTRIYCATSSDGLTWAKLNNDKTGIDDQDTLTASSDGRVGLGSNGKGDDAGVGGACVIPDGDTYKMWYTGSDGTTARIYLATSPDGFAWTKYDNTIAPTSDTSSSNGRLSVGSTNRGDYQNLSAPCVIKDGSVYRMWYSGQSNNTYRTYYATSWNGLAWMKYDNTIAPTSDTSSSNGRIPLGSADRGDDGQTYHPWVIKDDATYRMWYSGNDSSTVRIYYATSPDGVAWTKYNNFTPDMSDTTSTDGRLPIGTSFRGDARHVQYPRVIRDGGYFKMWYSGYENASTILVYHATQYIPWPTVANGDAVNVAANEADLVGQVIARGETRPELTMFVGKRDGEFVKANWETNYVVGLNCHHIVDRFSCQYIVDREQKE